jgi:periplasmic divalent cation tolerance protein
MTDKIVVLVTANGMPQARKLARALVDKRLAACVNLVSPVRSIYRWEGRLCEDRECLLVIKSTRGQFAAVQSCVERLHSYSVPEVIALPIVDGAPNYLNWIAESVLDARQGQAGKGDAREKARKGNKRQAG